MNFFEDSKNKFFKLISKINFYNLKNINLLFIKLNNL